MKEIWISIPGFEGFYEVSSLGLVRSVDRKVYNPLNGLVNRKGKLLRASPNLSGYLTVVLSKYGIYYTRMVHRLVAISFIENKDNLPQINHINGNKKDNSLINLEWCNNRYNHDHAVSIGLYENSYKRYRDAKRAVIIHNGINRSISFPSCIAAALYLKTSGGAVGNVLNGSRMSIKGYFVEYI